MLRRSERSANKHNNVETPQPMKQPKSELIHLKNLGAASVNILNAVGIHTPEELQAIGAVEAYARIKARGIHVSKVMLYALEGALIDAHWTELADDHKSKLVALADGH